MGRDSSRERSPRGNEDWREYEVHLCRHWKWWDGPRGIIDSEVMLMEKNTASEGKKLRTAFSVCKRILIPHPCEYKVGMARSVAARWRYYLETTDKWQPTHLWIVLKTGGREGVGFAEAALINMLANDPDERVPQTLNINLRNGDLGGTGPRLLEHFFSTYYLYLAVKADAVP